MTATVVPGRAGEFFSGGLRIGLSSVYSDYAVMNVFTNEVSCKPLFIDVGQTATFPNVKGGETFVITLLGTSPRGSVDITVQRRPLVRRSPRGQTVAKTSTSSTPSSNSGGIAHCCGGACL